MIIPLIVLDLLTSSLTEGHSLLMVPRTDITLDFSKMEDFEAFRNPLLEAASCLITALSIANAIKPNSGISHVDELHDETQRRGPLKIHYRSDG